MADTIGRRLVQAIQDRAEKNGTKKNAEAAKLGISRVDIYRWEHTNINPQAYFLQQAALAGYDVYWILTGKEKRNATKLS